MRVLPCLVLAAATVACRKSEPPPTTKDVQLFLNHTPIPKVTGAQIMGWPRLDRLIAAKWQKIGKWEHVWVTGVSDTAVDLVRPADAYHGQVPALFPGEAGDPAFGMFEPDELAKHGTPSWHLDHVRQILIKFDPGNASGMAVDPNLAVTIKTAKGTRALTGDELGGITREEVPFGDAPGWKLTTLLDHAGVTQFSRLVLTDAKGKSVTVTRDDISSTSVPFLKLNRRNKLHFRVYRQEGGAWRVHGDLRDLASIDVID